jgi:hypothetical protein
MATCQRLAAPKRTRPVQQRVRPVVQRILDSMATPALVQNARVDYLAANPLGRALYAPLFDSREQPTNSARFTFLDPAAVDFYAGWDRVADDLVAHLRSEAGRHPYDRGLSDLIGQLSTRSPSSAPARPRTTCAFTAPAPSACITRSSATWTSATRRWNSRPTAA